MLSILDLNKVPYQSSLLDDLYEMVAPLDVQNHWREFCPNWLHATSLRRWLCITALFMVPWIAGIILLVSGVRDLGFGAFSSYGLGQSNTQTIFTQASTLSANMVLANTPQLFVSLLYVLYNALFTCMLLGAEWTSYDAQKKPLRVTRPQGRQLGTLFLQLPSAYSMPLLGACAALHWLISQTIFVVALQVRDYTTTLDPPPATDYDMFGCGWSPLGLLLTLILSGIMILILWNIAKVEDYSAHMPLAGSSSKAISAACHPLPEDTVDTTEILQYGVVRKGARDEAGHACFTKWGGYKDARRRALLLTRSIKGSGVLEYKTGLLRGSRYSGALRLNLWRWQSILHMAVPVVQPFIRTP